MARSSKVEKAVLVTTSHRGVFFGYASETDGATIKMRGARNCVYWSSDVKGFLGLAATGPSKSCKVGPAADIELRACASGHDERIQTDPNTSAKTERKPALAGPSRGGCSSDPIYARRPGRRKPLGPAATRVTGLSVDSAPRENSAHVPGTIARRGRPHCRPQLFGSDGDPGIHQPVDVNKMIGRARDRATCPGAIRFSSRGSFGSLPDTLAKRDAVTRCIVGPGPREAFLRGVA